MRNVSELKKQFEEQFGTNLSARELWLLVKLAKHVRLRCRNNAAFNNFMNQMFPYATFRQVTKSRPDGTTYPGLSITVGPETVEDANGEDGD